MASVSRRKELQITYTRLIISLMIAIDRQLIVSSSDSSPPKRCCSPGSVLTSKDGSYSCKSVMDNGVEFFQRNPGNWGVPVCQNGGNLRSIPLDDFKPDEFLRGDFCADLFLESDENFQTDLTPVVLTCDHSNQGWEKRPIPELVKLRRCCPQGEVFHTTYRACLEPDFPDQDVSTDSLIRNLGDYDFIQATRGPPKCEFAIFDYEVNASDVYIADGKLQVNISGSNDSVDFILTEKTGCLDAGSSPGLLLVRVCRGIDHCRTHSCVRKCCREDQAYVKAACEKLPSHLTAAKWHSEVLNRSINTEPNVTDGVLNTTEYGIIFGKPCLYRMWPALTGQTQWHIVTQGKAHVANYQTYEYDQHCIEMFYDLPPIPDGFHSFICHGEPPPDLEEEQAAQNISSNWVTASLALVSCAFLLMTLIVYMCLPPLRNLQGKNLMCYVASLFFGYLCLALVSVASPTKILDDQTSISTAAILCKTWGYAMFFSYFSAFSWLNVMCFDVWWTFGSMTRSQKSTPNRKNDSRRFLSYCLYGYGLPSAALIFAVLVDHHQLFSRPFRPDIGNNTCWFAKGPNLYGQLIYFTVPLTIQMLVNLVSFIVTVRRCNRTKLEVQKRSEVDRSDARKHRFEANKTRLILNLKLFVFMGISWVMESVSYFCTTYGSNSEFTKKFFYATDLLNLLQGLMIFVLFVMKRKVISGLEKRFTTGGTPRSSVTGVHDPHRVRKSPSNSTMLSTFQNSSP